MEKIKLMLYGVARYLCIAFFLNIACLIFGVSVIWPLTPIALVAIAVLLGLAFPRRPKGRWQGFRETIVYFLSAFHLLLVGLWMHFVLGYFGMALNARFRAMTDCADRVVIYDNVGFCHAAPTEEPALYETTNKAEIVEFNALFRFAGTTLQCKCCGYPGVYWWRDGKRIGALSIHHGKAVRVEGKGCDWRLTLDSGQHIEKWLKEHCGVSSKDGASPTPLKCRLSRYELAAAVESFMKAKDGKRPTPEELRAQFNKIGKNIPSCPASGKYALTFDEDGTVHVTCSILRHNQ